MKTLRCLFILAPLWLLNLVSGQIELGPLTQNYDQNVLPQLKIGTIDSSFIYSTDTVGLPFFDDFTTNKIQQYIPDFSSSLATSELYYYLIDQATALPLANDLFFTNQVTFHRYFDPTEGTFTDTIFTPQAINIADFSSYPVDYEPVDLYPPYYIYDTLGPGDESDTVWIQNPPFFQDSARQFFLPVSDPSLLWVDNYVYHNYRFGDHPRTLGVMTFDGLDESGYPYAIGTTSSGYADVLTSKPIDLSGMSPADSVYISLLRLSINNIWISRFSSRLVSITT